MKEINLLKKENENLKNDIKNALNDFELISVDLKNGASNFNSGYNQFKVYKMKNNFVKLSGLINCSLGNSFCQLPENCRPKQQLIFNCMANNKSTRVDILADGNIFVSGSGSSWLSLDNILFLSEKWKSI